MEVFFTDIALLQSGLGVSTTERQALGLVHRMPFLLGEDAEYDRALNAFFRSLPTRGARSPNTWEAYARDICMWARFLAARGKTVWTAANEDLVAYHQRRRLTRDAAEFVDPSTWNRGVSALEKLYTYAIEQRLVEASPFLYRPVRGSSYSTHARGVRERVNTAHEAGARRKPIKYISLEQFLFFRDVGLRGRLPSGAADPMWRGRNSARNAAYAELLTNAGLRNGEASSLLCRELPSLPTNDHRSVPLDVSPQCAKGNVGRTVLVPVRVLRLIFDYIELERDVALGRALDASDDASYSLVANPLLLRPDAQSPKYFLVGSRNVLRIERMDPEARSRAVEVDESDTPVQPARIWLTGSGQPLEEESWNRVFRRATERCRRFNPEWRRLNVTPHTLRHTFAVNMLAELTRAYYGAFLPGELRSELMRATREITGNPLLRLKILMGHRSIETTMIYLEYMEEAREIVETASLAWSTKIASGL